ncbi:hypothetical protein CEXT_41391 [Caerostris extrusa]|uniref:Uncharacterized protein n=1 Tax=Caerostris extrusa TaxID=172846 RepID=A0AAV4P203_CAEEX|nr:hypothetical protein CEXT_41391 [Caerostris extrusa]
MDSKLTKNSQHYPARIDPYKLREECLFVTAVTGGPFVIENVSKAVAVSGIMLLLAVQTLKTISRNNDWNPCFNPNKNNSSPRSCVQSFMISCRRDRSLNSTPSDTRPNHLVR